jgi:hypothetical protein
MLFKRFFAITFVVAIVLASGQATRAADTANKKDAVAMLSQMRVRQLTKSLSLTEEQQKKVQSLYDEEGDRIRALQANESLELNERMKQQSAVHKATVEKMKLFLTEEQKTKLEALDNPPRKKRSAPAKSAGN